MKTDHKRMYPHKDFKAKLEIVATKDEFVELANAIRELPHTKRIGRSERAVRLYMFRHGIPLRQQTKCPTIPHLLEIKFGNANWFHPTREFYEQVGITQKRWQDLRMQYAAPTQEELVKISRVLHLQTEEALQLVDSVQLELFGNE